MIISVVSLSSMVRIGFPENASEEMFEDIISFLSLIGTVSSGKGVIEIAGAQKIDEDKKKHIGEFIGTNIKKYPQLKEMGEFLKRLRKEEYVYFLPGQYKDNELHDFYYELLKLNEPNFSEKRYAETLHFKRQLEGQFAF